MRSHAVLGVIAAVDLVSGLRIAHSERNRAALMTDSFAPISKLLPCADLKNEVNFQFLKTLLISFVMFCSLCRMIPMPM